MGRPHELPLDEEATHSVIIPAAADASQVGKTAEKTKIPRFSFGFPFCHEMHTDVGSNLSKLTVGLSIKDGR